MALIAHFADHRFMDIVVKNCALTGTVGIMTGGATTLFHRIIEMSCLEGCLVRLMTLEAKRLHIGFQELVVVRRGVWGMATQTIFFNRGMFELVFLDFLCH